MRELGIIAEERNARTLADYLLTLGIETRLVTNRDGRVAVWVRREEKVAEARTVFDEFDRDPADPRFDAAARAAGEIRKQARKVEALHQKKTRNLRDRWEGPLHRRAPLTFLLAATCVAVFLLDQTNPRVARWLTFSVRTVSAEGYVRDSGFTHILAGQVWRLFTPIFLHADLFHIGLNLIALMALGPRIEMRKGIRLLALIVLASAVLGNVGQYVESGGNFGGISGVVFALAGYLWIKGQVDPADGLSLNDRSARLMFIWFLIGIIAPTINPQGQGFPFNMANTAHGVGLLSGLIFGVLRL